VRCAGPNSRRRSSAALADGPKLTRKPSDALNAEEAAAVLAGVQGDRLEAMAVLAPRLGLRRGELLALRWSDVDFDAAELTIGTPLPRPVGARSRSWPTRTPRCGNGGAGRPRNG
jgi:integrase